MTNLVRGVRVGHWQLILEEKEEEEEEVGESAMQVRPIASSLEFCGRLGYAVDL